MLEIKSTALRRKLLGGTMKSLFNAKLHRAVHPRNLYFNLQRFFERSWLMRYRGVVTVTATDFGPRTPLTTGAIE